MSTPMIAMTTSSSMSVKPKRRLLLEPISFLRQRTTNNKKRFRALTPSFVRGGRRRFIGVCNGGGRRARSDAHRAALDFFTTDVDLRDVAQIGLQLAIDEKT